MYTSYQTNCAVFGNSLTTETLSGLFNILQGYYAGYQQSFASPQTL